MTMQPLLEIEGLDVTLRNRGVRGGMRRILRNINLDIRAGETVGLVGESGSGKSTLGRAVLGLTPVAAGRISFAGGEFFVAGVHDGLFAAATVVQHRFVNVASGNTDLLAMLHVGDGAAADGLFNGLFDVVTVTPQETLAVYRALVLAIEASVDHIAHGEPSGQLHVTSFKPRAGSLETSGQLPGQRPGSTRLSLPYCDLRTRRYHSESSRTCLSV